MKRTSFAGWPCSVARAVDLLGDWWTPLVLRDAMYGIRRFDDFERSLGVSRNVLSQRLGRLVDEGLLDKVAYQDRPPRYEYRLTDKGRDFFGVVAALIAWGDRWLAPDGPPVTLRHTTCGHVTTAQVTCSECGEPLELREVRGELGPGYPKRFRAAAARDGRFGPIDGEIDGEIDDPTEGETA